MRWLRTSLMYVSLWIISTAHLIRYGVSIFSGEKGKLSGVRIIILRDREVLLLSHWYAPWAWTLPGGGVDANEKPEDAAIREAREETGLIINSIAGEVGTYKGTMGKRDRVFVFYTGDFSGSLSLKPNFEIMARSWFSLDDLPKELSPANRRRIEAYKSGVRGEQGKW